MVFVRHLRRAGGGRRLLMVRYGRRELGRPSADDEGSAEDGEGGTGDRM